MRGESKISSCTCPTQSTPLLIHGDVHSYLGGPIVGGSLTKPRRVHIAHDTAICFRNEPGIRGANAGDTFDNLIARGRDGFKRDIRRFAKGRVDGKDAVRIVNSRHSKFNRHTINLSQLI